MITAIAIGALAGAGTGLVTGFLFSIVVLLRKGRPQRPARRACRAGSVVAGAALPATFAVAGVSIALLQSRSS